MKLVKVIVASVTAIFGLALYNVLMTGKEIGPCSQEREDALLRQRKGE